MTHQARTALDVAIAEVDDRDHGEWGWATDLAAAAKNYIAHIEEKRAADRAEVKAAVEEWFTNISLDDLFAVKGWDAPASSPPAEPKEPVEKMAYWTARIINGSVETAGGSMDLDYAHDELTTVALNYLHGNSMLEAFKKAMTPKALEDMQAEVVAWAQRKGWYAPDEDTATIKLSEKVNPTLGEAMMLVVSETAEALEAYREWGLEDMTGIVVKVPESLIYEAGPDDARRLYLEHLEKQGSAPKPEGVGSEFADILIRLFHYAHLFGVDLRFEFERKMAHNERRPFRHGEKAL